MRKNFNTPRSKFITALIITTIIWIQPLQTMQEDKNIIYNDQDFMIFMLLSSVHENSLLWLPTDVIGYIMLYMLTITKFLSEMKFNCSTQRDLFGTTWKLNQICDSCPNMPVAFLKICLNNAGKSLFELKNDWGFTIFDIHYGPDSYVSEMKTWCLLVDRKAFIDHFKKPYAPFGFGFKTNVLHRYVSYNSNLVVMNLYCGVFLDYAKNCPKKSEEILKLFSAKDDNGDTISAIARKNGFVEIAVVIKNSKKELKRAVKKEACVIQ